MSPDNDSRNPRLKRQAAKPPPHPDLATPTLESIRTAAPSVSTLHTAMLALLSDETGWLRAVPADAGRTVYLKWKWTAGALANRYVMVVGEPADYANLLDLLAKKKDDAEFRGGRTVQDRFYSTE